MKNYESQEAYRITKVSLSYRQSIGLTVVSCCLCEFSFFRATAVTGKKEVFLAIFFQKLCF